MKIIQVEYSRLIGTGNYENEKVGGLAFVDVDEPPEEALTKLKEWVSDQINARLEDNRSAQEVHERDRELAEVTRRIDEARRKYDKLREILAAHGVNLAELPNYDDLPF